MRADVAVVIPCYNHARYLPDSIGSVLRQTYRASEIVVVDDGSTDETKQVASRYPEVRYVYQENRGLAAARNTGTRNTRSQFLVYLDADDVLAPEALAIGVRYLESHPHCAFVSGDHRLVGPDLQPLFKFRARPVERDHYLAFLRGNYVGMHATVMYRRQILERAGGFEEGLRACEDYGLYLRISREYPVLCHSEVVADYRQHASNMSRDPEFMLRWALRVHDAERPYITTPERAKAFAEGDRYLREYYGDAVLAQVRARFRISPADLTSIRQLVFVAANYPVVQSCRRTAAEKMGYIADALRRRIRRSTVLPPVGGINFGSLRTTQPLLPAATEAEALTTWYSDAWVERHKTDMRGAVLDFATADLNPAALDAVPGESYDCVLCVMRLQRVYDLRDAIRHLCRILKSPGVLLVTLPGVTIASDAGDEQDFWRFTSLSARSLMEPEFGSEHVQTEAFGSVVTAVGALHGIPAGHFTRDELLVSDAQHQTVVAVRATKHTA